MIAAVKRLIVFLCLLVVLAFVFRDGLLYYVWRWHEKTGEVKKALSGYTELIKKYPDSRWVKKAREAVDRLKN